jgi:tRNA-5-methyluridine54 2-sulfurtransferase
MVCKICKTKPVIQLTNNNVKLCKTCFLKYFESKAKNTIGKHKMIDKNDHIGVAVSGGKDSLTVLYIINKVFSKRKDIKITAIAIDEGIKGYREFSLKELKKLCKEWKIKLKVYSFKKEFKLSLDQMVKKHAHPCTVCGTFRRLLLNSKARKLGVTKLVTGHNLDDEAQTIIMNQFKRNIGASKRMGPITGIIKDPQFIPRVKPLYFLTEKEVKAYSFLKGFVDKFVECPYAKLAYRDSIRVMINDFEVKYPGTKHNIINSFMEILPSLKKSVKNLSISSCKKCKEPCSGDICRACVLIEKLNKQSN